MSESETRDYIARVNNTPDGGYGADAGYIGDRFCRTARVQVTDLDGTVIDDFDVDYYADEHDDEHLGDDEKWPNFILCGPGTELALATLRGRGWEPNGSAFEHDTRWSAPEPWHGGGDHEYMRVRKIESSA